MCSLPDSTGPTVNAGEADLQLQFAAAPGARTYLSHQFSRYPFHICRAQYLDAESDDMATVYLQSSAGGIFADDRLSAYLHVLPAAKAHVTSQASTVVHRMDRGDARQSVDIRVEGNGFLEYMPDPMILFPNAKLRSCVNVRVEAESTVILTDAYLAHDPAAGNAVFSVLYNEIRIEELGGKLLCLDRNVFSGDTFTGENVGIMGANRVQGTFLVLNSTVSGESFCDALRDGLQAHADVYAGISTLPNGCGVWARLLSREAVALRSALSVLWRTARKLLLGSYPSPRRK